MSEKTEPKLNETKRTEISVQPTVSEMATTTVITGGASTLSTDVWANCDPQQAGSQKVAEEENKKRYWANLYSSIGAQAFDEPKKRQVRAAIYVYCAINGTSRAGEYSLNLKTASGHTFSSAAIAKACGPLNIRKWMRSCAVEAHDYFTRSGILQKQEMLVVKCLDAGSDTANIIGVCDFMSECPSLTIGERRLSDALFTHNIRKARATRGGESLENVEDRQRELFITAQGDNSENGSVLHI